MEKPGRKLSRNKGKNAVVVPNEAENEKEPSPPENGDVNSSATELMDTKCADVKLLKQEPESPAKSAANSPAKKRARLSLKGNKAVQRLSSFFGPEPCPREGNMAPSMGGSMGGKGDRNDNIALYGKPCVASLHNLGNTCFLNSVLQVLRHTPGFLNMISHLNQEVTKTESLQEFVVNETTSEGDDDEIMTWTLVGALEEVFEKMKLAEEKYKSRTSHYLAVRPYDMMSAIEKINPMFEGNMQHDVHELLRCLLAYMQDAVRELNKFRSGYKEKYLGDNVSITLKSQVKSEPAKDDDDEESKTETEDIKSEENDVTEIDEAADVKDVQIVTKTEAKKAPTSKPPARKTNKLSKSSTPKVKKEGETCSTTAKGRKNAIKQENKTVKGSAKTEQNESDGEDSKGSNASKNSRKSASARARTSKTPKAANKTKDGAQIAKKNSRKTSGKTVKVEIVSGDRTDQDEDCKEEEVDDEKKSVPKVKPKKQPRKLSTQAGQRKLNGFLSPVENPPKNKTTEKPVDAAKSTKDIVQNGHSTSSKVNGKLPNTPKKKQNGLAVKVSLQKNAYKTPEKANIAMTASSPVTAKQIFAKHKMISETENPASGDTPVVAGVLDADEVDGTTEEVLYKAALHSPTGVINGESATSEGAVNGDLDEASDSVQKEVIKKSQRGRVVKVTPKAAALVVKASKKRKFSSDDNSDKETLKSPSKTASKARSKSRKSSESASDVKENGKENVKALNGKGIPKQLNVLSMLKNPVPRKRLGVRGSVVRKPEKEDVNTSDTSLNLSDQIDGCCDDPHLKDRDPFEDNPPDMVEEILNSGSYTIMPVYLSSDDSEMDGLSDSDIPTDLLNDVTDLLPPDDTYDSFDEYITDSSDLDEEYLTSDINEHDEKSAEVKIEIDINVAHPDFNAKDSRDKRAISASPESTTSQQSIKMMQKRLKLADNEQEDDKSGESDVDANDTIPQLDGVFDEWKIPRPKQTARKSCPTDRATVPSEEEDGHEESDSETQQDLKEAVTQVHQAFVKLSTSDVPSYLQQQVLSLLQSKVSQQGDVTDSVRTTFEGEMALRTRCLECENSTERKEEYQDISLAVKRQRCEDDSEDEEAEESKTGSSSHDELEWLRSALADVESLDGDNKYFCDRCCRLTEAQRSMHYVTLPRVLTLHLKRFAATNGVFGGLTKINDHVPTPLELPCIQDNCAKNCTDPAHKYTLYGVITHTGISISSGHYISYVRVTDRNLWPDMDISDDTSETADNGNNNNSAVHMQTEDGLADPNNNADTNNNLDANDIMPNQNAVTTVNHTENNMAACSDATTNSNTTNSRWLECDDDTIRVLSDSEFEDILSNSGAGTPYMLFYHTVLDQFENMCV